MKRITFILMAILALVLGCESDEDAYNVAGFQEVKEYVDATIPLTDEMIDQTKMNDFSKMDEIIAAMEEVDEELFLFGEDDPYNLDEMKEWDIDLGLQQGEWEISGKELHENLIGLKEKQDEYIATYHTLQSANDVKKENLVSELDALLEARAALGDQMRK